MSGALMDQLENINPDGRGRKLMPPTKPYTASVTLPDGTKRGATVWARSPEDAWDRIRAMALEYWGVNIPADLPPGVATRSAAA